MKRFYVSREQLMREYLDLAGDAFYRYELVQSWIYLMHWARLEAGLE